ncbi:MAG: pentapeptide repeat-containing protein [SAR324 cluster bacterium]|nr:pentapeptide repeat-containing protein [SAR324 cluster bacterium]
MALMAVLIPPLLPGTPTLAQERTGSKEARSASDRKPLPSKEELANHAAWLRSLGNPQLLEMMGVIQLSAENRRDPRRMVFKGRDLRGFNAPKANLAAADLTGSRLDGAQLAGVTLSYSLMEGVNLSGANLEGAKLTMVNLAGANLAGANLAGADLRNSNLRGVDLSQANLSRADLSGSVLIGANLTRASLHNANLSNTDLSQAVLTNADLELANLSGSDLFEAKLSNARIRQTNLSGANLFGADLSGALLLNSNLSRANLTGAVLQGTNLFANALEKISFKGVSLAGVIFEPPVKRLASIKKNLDHLVKASDLGLMTFRSDPEPLEKLRRMLNQGEYRWERLEITYAIRRGKRQQASKEGTFMEQAGGLLQLFFIELTIEYGAAPFRPMTIVLVMIFLFGFVYMIPLIVPSKTFGEIWLLKPKDRFARRSVDGAIRERLVAGSFRDLPIAFWFSFLSAMNIGGRIFNIDDLFINCQREEYYLRATGWVRTLSGIQALLTLYLFLLTAMIFFEQVAF